MPHFPVVEILALLLKLRHNRPFMRISRILFLSLVAVSAVSYWGEWIKAMDPTSPACLIGKWDCYIGPTRSLPEVVSHLGGSTILFALPMIDLAAAALLLFKPPRAFLLLLGLSFVSGFLGCSAQPDPYLYFTSGSGSYLHLFCQAVIFFLSFPLALDEHAQVNPNWDF